MDTITRLDAALHHLAALHQDAQHAHLVQQARGCRPRLVWRRVFHVPSVPAPTALCATC